MKTYNDLVQALAQHSGLMISQLTSIIKTAPLRYKKFYIKKRNGTLREVAQPAREVKLIQRWLVNQLEQTLPVSHASTAYKKDASIKKNATLHINSRYLLKMDFKDFFPSITALDIKKHLNKYCGSYYDQEAIDLIVQACTWSSDRTSNLKLCIGAPSSPLLSNSIMYDFDCIIETHTSSNAITYSRYADDLIFSCNDKYILSSYPELVKKITQELTYPKLLINNNKTIQASKSGKRMVTGIVITPDHQLSVGRSRKRLVRAMYHRFTKGELNEEETLKMFGLINFINDIEIGFASKIKSR